MNSFSFLKKLKFIFFLKNINFNFSSFDKRDFFFIINLWFFFLFHLKKLFLSFKFKLDCFYKNIFFFKKYFSFYKHNFFNKIFYSYNSEYYLGSFIYSLGSNFFFNRIFLVNFSILNHTSF